MSNLTSVALENFTNSLGARSYAGSIGDHFQVASMPELFVPPVLVEKELSSGSGAPITLVSARGAAGKSHTAQALSATLGVPLWRLELDKAVSAVALDWSVAQISGASSATDAVRAGLKLVLIDSIDEARALVSLTSWHEFLTSITEASKSGMDFVLFGRERTLEEVFYELDDQGVAARWLEISHFDGPAQNDYIDAYVDRRDPASRSTIANYEAARNQVVKSIGSSVPEEHRAAFVGYAPVLDAIGAILAEEDNYFGLSKKMAEDSHHTDSNQILAGLLYALLTRDQGKMAPLASQLGLDPSLTFTPAEQLAWLIHEIEDGPAPDLTWIPDPNDREEYRKRISEFVSDHPFRDDTRWASAVFAAYALSQVPSRFGVGKRVLDIGHNSSLLFDFVSGGSLFDVVDEWQFAALHASVQAGSVSGSDAIVALAEEEDGTYSATINVVRLGAVQSISMTLVPESTDHLAIYGPLSNLVVSSPHRVTLAPQSSSALLGPNLRVSAQQLSIVAADVEFAPRLDEPEDDDASVVLESVESPVMPAVLSRQPAHEEFELRLGDGSHAPYPWHQYVQPIVIEVDIDPTDRAVRFLKMLMNLTRNHGHAGERGVFNKKLEGRQSIKGDHFARTLSLLIDLGVCRLEREMVYVRDEVEAYRFSGKTQPGQRLIGDVWDYWGPVAERISKILG